MHDSVNNYDKMKDSVAAVDNSTVAQQKQSGRIAKNTMLLFVRMFILMLIDLFAVRMAMKELGKVDYGINSAVASIVTMLPCLGGVLSIATQRFYSAASGQNDKKLQGEVFSVSININLVFSAVVLILFETIGVWFVGSCLNIQSERIGAALWTYQFAIFTCLNTLMQIPFMAAVVANEDMHIYTVITTGECLLRLAVVCTIGMLAVDRLVYYGAGYFVVSVIVILSYIIVGHRKYAECVYRKVKNHALYRQVLSFSGWTLFGTTANYGLLYGNTILLNIFFGPIINAAFDISLKINNAFGSLTNSVVLAFRPAMIRSCAAKDFSYLNRLFTAGNKFLLAILAAVGIPIMLEMDTILGLWLTDSDANMVLFCRLIIFYIVVLALHHPITIIMQALGLVRQYHLPTESATLLCLPVTWLLFHFGCPSWTVFLSMVGVCVLSHAIRLYCIKRHYEGFSLRHYFLAFLLPSLLVIAVVALGSSAVHAAIAYTYIRLVVVFVFAALCTLLLTYFFVLNAEEKEFVRQICNKVLGKINSRFNRRVTMQKDVSGCN